MIINHFTVARPARRHLDLVHFAIWIGVPAAWVALLAAIVVRVLA